MKTPHQGGRYFREKNKTLTRADENGDRPKSTAPQDQAASSETANAGSPAGEKQATTVKGKNNG